MDCAKERVLIYIGKTRHDVYYVRTRCPECESEAVHTPPVELCARLLLLRAKQQNNDFVFAHNKRFFLRPRSRVGSQSHRLFYNADRRKVAAFTAIAD